MTEQIKIFDCFTFFNELDLLEIRLAELNSVIDYFVIVEANKTFTNKKRNFCFEANMERFTEYLDKIIYIKVEDMPVNPKNAWELEEFQRNAILRGLNNCKPNDYVIISDVDEIPKAASIKKFRGEKAFLKQNLYYYKFNCLSSLSWLRAAILKKKYLTTPEEIRKASFNEEKLADFKVIENGGWHFSYIGDEAKIKEKIEAFSHQELNKKEYKDEKKIAEKITKGKDLFGREIEFNFIPLDHSFPKHVLKNQEKFSKYIDNSVPIAEELKRSLSPDKYGRYANIAEVINNNRSKGESFKILDVGGRENILRDFLLIDDVYYLDPFVESDEENFIKGDGAKTGLKDEAFDWVVSADVFEHIPVNRRETFISENIRISKRGVILAAPFYSKEVEEAENNLNQNYKKIYGEEYIWLEEHKKNGLPKVDEMENILKKNRLNYFYFSNNNLSLWEFYLGIILDAIRVGKSVQKELFDLNYFYNENIFKNDYSEPAYRKIFVISKQKELKKLNAGRSLTEKEIAGVITAGNNLQAAIRQKDVADLSKLNRITNDLSVNYLEVSKERKAVATHLVAANMWMDKLYRKPQILIKHWIKVLLKKLTPKALKKSIKSALDKYRRQKELGYFKEKSITFPKVVGPEVSIVILFYNKWEYSYACLKSIKEKVKNVSYEVVIVDNGSTDRTKNGLKKIKNATIVTPKENQGFVGGCNLGAKSAKGKHLVFLNNDTQVQEGWLESLVETFKNHEKVGIAGSKLVYPDGRLQEAGGIIWKNKNAWNFGKFDDPNKYEYNYVKEVDYISGASIMIPKDLFLNLGGFDEMFMPGYFEDSDLAFKVREAGLKVLYQPMSEVIHFEGITSGTDLASGMKKYQVKNQDKFYKRWDKALETGNLEESEGPFLARDRSKGKKVLLYVDHQVPTWDCDAGSFITYEYIKIFLGLGYKVIFWPQDRNKTPKYTEALQQLGVEVAYGDVSFKDFIVQNGMHITTTILSRPDIAKDFIDDVRLYTSSKIHYLTHDLHYVRMARQAKIDKNKELEAKSAQMKEIEYDLMKKSDLTWLVSTEEVKIVKKNLPGVKTFLYPWVEKVAAPQEVAGFESREGVFFLGGFKHKPNIDAALWLKKEIYPYLKKAKIPVKVCGSNPPEEVKELVEEGFEVVGFLCDEDLDKLFNKAKVFISPLRYGAGFKGKIAKSISRGTPVVATNIGAEGMGLKDGVNVLVADSAKDFAEKVIKVYSSKSIWEGLSKASLKHAKSHYSIKNARDQLSKIL